MSSKVCAVIYMNGFSAGNKFVCRELGYCSLTNDDHGVVKFNLSKQSTTEADLWVNKFYEKRHGLNFAPDEREKTVEVDKLDFVLYDLWKTCSVIGRNAIAFKGRGPEWRVLKRLGIPRVDLDHYACPRIKFLLGTCRLDSTDHCPNHTEAEMALPCGKARAKVYKTWLEENIDW